jgi:hypothetical protein
MLIIDKFAMRKSEGGEGLHANVQITVVKKSHVLNKVGGGYA